MRISICQAKFFQNVFYVFYKKTFTIYKTLPIINIKMRKNIFTVVLFLIAIALIVIGAKMGGATEVLQKASMICLECIGIG